MEIESIDAIFPEAQNISELKRFVLLYFVNNQLFILLSSTHRAN